MAKKMRNIPNDTLVRVRDMGTVIDMDTPSVATLSRRALDTVICTGNNNINYSLIHFFIY